MLRIYLLSSTDLKLCSDVPTSLYLHPGTWVPVSGSLHLGPRTVGPSTWDPNIPNLRVRVPVLGSQHLGPFIRGPGSQGPIKSFCSNIYPNSYLPVQWCRSLIHFISDSTHSLLLFSRLSLSCISLEFRGNHCTEEKDMVVFAVIWQDILLCCTILGQIWSRQILLNEL